jgi:hypothetical protein
MRPFYESSIDRPYQSALIRITTNQEDWAYYRFKSVNCYTFATLISMIPSRYNGEFAIRI